MNLKIVRSLYLATMMMALAPLVVSVAQAATGSVGDKGPAGPAGPVGAKGVKGAAGDKGDKGPTGPAGPMGPAGAKGPAGTGGQAVAGTTCASSVPVSTLGAAHLQASLDQLYGVYEFQTSQTESVWGYWASPSKTCATGSTLLGSPDYPFCDVGDLGPTMCNNGSTVNNQHNCTSEIFTKIAYGTISFDGAGNMGLYLT
ncbi:hypothetical protein LBMAG43_06280 [Methylococcaceae bacterium]|nr:hypothetical protein LBMAG43_06280 [Methylococcaceae bacterium]